MTDHASEDMRDREMSDADAPAAELASGGGLRALEPREIRARRRPRAVLYVWAWQLACGAFAAIPIHGWAQRVWGAHPDGDAVLFRPAGRALLAWLGGGEAALATVARTTFLTLIIGAILGQIVTGALIASLATGRGEAGRAPETSDALGAGLRSFAPLLGFGIVAAAFEGFLVGVGLLASASVDGALQASLGDARAFTARLVVLGLFVVLALLVGVVADLGRVAIAREVALAERPSPTWLCIRDGIIAAIRAARASLGPAAIAWGWRAALGALLVYAGAIAGDVAGARGGGALVALFAVHQIVMLARTGLRASWLANALRLVLR